MLLSSRTKSVVFGEEQSASPHARRRSSGKGFGDRARDFVIVNSVLQSWLSQTMCFPCHCIDLLLRDVCHRGSTVTLSPFYCRGQQRLEPNVSSVSFDPILAGKTVEIQNMPIACAPICAPLPTVLSSQPATHGRSRNMGVWVGCTFAPFLSFTPDIHISISFG